MALFGGNSTVATIIMQGAQALTQTMMKAKELKMEEERQSRLFQLQSEQIKLREENLQLETERAKIQRMNAEATLLNAQASKTRADTASAKVGAVDGKAQYEAIQRAASVRSGRDDADTTRIKKFAGYPTVDALTDVRGKILSTRSQVAETAVFSGKVPEQDPQVQRLDQELKDLEAEIAGRSSYIQETFAAHGNQPAVEQAEAEKRVQYETAVAPLPTSAAPGPTLVDPGVVAKLKANDDTGVAALADRVWGLPKDTRRKLIDAYYAAHPSPDWTTKLAAELRNRAARSEK